MKMNLEFISTSLKPICEGCLSLDRKLSPVEDVEIRKFFKELVSPLACYSENDHLNHPSVLCWECTAIIKRTLKYKKQVENAHRHLVQYMLRHISNPPNLSNLSKCTNSPEVIFHHDEKNSNTKQRQIKKSESESAELPLNSTEEPLVEIKEEKNYHETDFGHLEGCYVDDDGDVKDHDLEAVLKSTTVNHIESGIHLTKNEFKTVEDFGESDDEPLKKRTEVEDETKSKGKRGGNRREHAAGVVRHPRVARRLQQLQVPEGKVEMVVLTWEEVEEERQRALQSTNFTRHKYRCEDCALGFNHRFKLDNHMQKHDPSSGDMECSACHIRCRDAHALSAHRRRHRVRWRCTTCGDTSSRASVAADHYARQHGASPPAHVCSACGHTAQSLGRLRLHMKNHAERPKCDLCDKSFRDKSSLRTHMFIHKGEKEYSCSLCGKEFLFKYALQVHAKTHEASAHLYCHQCDMTFKNEMTYYQHMKYNLKHVDPDKLKHTCETCGKKFSKAVSLKEHNTAVHLKTTPVSCTMPECTFTCATRTVLRTHIRMVHRNLREVKNHVCHTCGKAYKTKASLEGHMRLHSGERPFACAKCSSTFAFAAALYNHNKLVHLKAKRERHALANGKDRQRKDRRAKSPAAERDSSHSPLRAAAADAFSYSHIL
ncbi:hypothetical protein ABMA27_012184 [Loxostege sticticalis]|uniref:C2H2-type domain-containing protein n=1 Tax=Loxostege sticticalis TaxID=481309 RepID=A0ABR3H0K4_LOXSC